MNATKIINEVQKKIEPLIEQFSSDRYAFKKAANYIMRHMTKHPDYLTPERRDLLAQHLVELRNNGNPNFLFRLYSERIKDIDDRKKHYEAGNLGLHEQTILKREQSKLEIYEKLQKLTYPSIINLSDIADIFGVSIQTISVHAKSSNSEEKEAEKTIDTSPNSQQPSKDTGTKRKTPNPPKERDLTNWIYYILGYALIYGVSPLYLLGMVDSPDIYVVYNLYDVKRLSVREEKIRLIADKELRKKLTNVKKYKHRDKPTSVKKFTVHCQRKSDFIKRENSYISYNHTQKGYRIARNAIFEDISTRNRCIIDNLLLNIFDPTSSPSLQSNEVIQEELAVNKEFLLMILELTFVDRMSLAQLRTLMNYRIQYRFTDRAIESILANLKLGHEMPKKKEYLQRKDQFLLKEYLTIAPLMLLNDFCKFEYDCLANLLIIFMTSNVRERKNFVDDMYFYGIIKKNEARLDKLTKLASDLELNQL